MSSDYQPKNYGLFGKYIAKISKAIISKLGSRENIITFLEELCRCGDIRLAAEKTLKNLISPLLLHKIINSDRNLSKCVNLAKGYASGMTIVKAESVLYELGVNGCHKSLMAYLKANSPKYQSNIKNVSEIKKPDSMAAISNDMDVFEIEAYGLDNENEEESSK